MFCPANFHSTPVSLSPEHTSSSLSFPNLLPALIAYHNVICEHHGLRELHLTSFVNLSITIANNSHFEPFINTYCTRRDCLTCFIHILHYPQILPLTLSNNTIIPLLAPYHALFEIHKHTLQLFLPLSLFLHEHPQCKYCICSASTWHETSSQICHSFITLSSTTLSKSMIHNPYFSIITITLYSAHHSFSFEWQ